MRLRVPNLSPRYKSFNFETKCYPTFHPSVFSYTIRNHIVKLKSGDFNQWNLDTDSSKDLNQWIDVLSTSAISISHHLKYNGITTILLGLAKLNYYTNHIWESLISNLTSILDKTTPKYQTLSLWAISIKLANSRLKNYDKINELDILNPEIYKLYFESLENRILDSSIEYTGRDIATFSSAIINIYHSETPLFNNLNGSFKLLVPNLIFNKHKLSFKECSYILKASKIVSHRPNSLIMHLVASMHLSLVTESKIRFGDLKIAFEFLPSGRLRHSMDVDTALSKEISSLAILLCKELNKYTLCNRLSLIVAETIIRTRIRNEVPETVRNVIEVLSKSLDNDRISKALKLITD